MLQLINIRKAYTTGDFTQVALDDVSISFRDNEFVAILGPSGSGKTTMLNIIGGLDHYDSGNLIIDGISTEKYKDRDWDTFRNNRIGFVFQSYNLIPHQSVLANVELALTLSGVHREERHRRALEALEKVGLSEHANKRPNQLSGGQMQRVAIARALINDPEILLADEPTGALDSKTSTQIMDLLTEIANDRLVVMVTHNPELAEAYATRIVNLSDGHIVSDSDPFDPGLDETRESTKPVRRTAMSFFTALALSFNNLMTKKGRTIMTAFAGSIGIIGIAAILALANGVQDYIDTVEEQTLSEYPLEIMNSGFDLSSLLIGATGSESYGDEEADDAEKDGDEDSGNTDSGGSSGGMFGMFGGNQAAEYNDLSSEGEVGIAKMVSTMFSSVGSNDLASLKKFLDSDESGMDPYVNAIEYGYGISPQIFSSDTENLRQVNPDRSLTPLGLGASDTSNNLISMTMSTNVFAQLPSDERLYKSQYEVLAGRWPESYNELVLVTSASGRISDFLLYTLGLRDADELDEMVRKFADEEDVEAPEDIEPVPFDDILGIKYKLVNAYDYYSYDSNYDVWVDKYDDKDYMKDLVSKGEDLTVVGIIRPRENATATMLSGGLNYPASLVEHVVNQAAESKIVKEQLENPTINVFTGKRFGEEEPDNEFDMQSLFTINTDSLRAAFKIDESALAVDMGNALDFSSLASNMPEVPEPNLNDMISNMDTAGTAAAVSILMASVMQDYADYLTSYYQSMATTPSNPGAGTGSGSSSSGSSGAGNAGTGGSVSGDTGSGGDTGSATPPEAAPPADTGSGETPAPENPADDGGAATPPYQVTPSEAFTDTASISAVPQSTQRTLDSNVPLETGVASTFGAESVEQGVISRTFSSPQATSAENTRLASLALTEGGNPESGGGNLPSSSITGGPMSAIEYLNTPEVQAEIGSAVAEISSEQNIQGQVASALQNYVQTTLTTYMTAMTSSLQSELVSTMENVMSQISANMASAVSIDSDAFANAFQSNMTEQELVSLMTSMMDTQDATYDNNLVQLGYADYADPTSVSIYPIDFAAKEEVINILNDYNDRMEADGEDDRMITYTDFVGTLMSSVTDIVDMISTMLIAFVAISLVVSSIMIGVITYISVLERRKEIGILRAIGASKRNISEVFNAETVIEGLVAGILGVGITALGCIPANIIVYNIFDVPNIAQLPWGAALILIGISVLLTFIAGLLPASSASRKDPVEALRSE